MKFNNCASVPILVGMASTFAEKAHNGQYRKYTKNGVDPEPYIVHPVAVMTDYYDSLTRLERQAFGVDVFCAAALLHDVVEDTPVTLEEIECEFGSAVASAVYSLSKPEKRAGINRAGRNRDYLDKLLVASDHVKIIKLCDINHNIVGISEFDDPFIPKYLRECLEIVGMFKEYNDPGNESLTNKIHSVRKNLMTEMEKLDSKHISWKEPKNAKR